jgi:hypothetical protein
MLLNKISAAFGKDEPSISEGFRGGRKSSSRSASGHNESLDVASAKLPLEIAIDPERCLATA